MPEAMTPAGGREFLRPDLLDGAERLEFLSKKYRENLLEPNHAGAVDFLDRIIEQAVYQRRTLTRGVRT